MTINPHNRLRNSFAEVVKRQAGELAELARDARHDPDVREALCFELDRIGGIAASLGLTPIERAARAALSAGDDEAFLEMVHRLVEACRGLEGVTPLFRPVIVIGLTRVNADDLAVDLRAASDISEALALAEAEDPGAFVVPYDRQAQLQERLTGALKAVPIFAVGPPGDLERRLSAARLGAAGYLGAPVRLDRVLDQVRARAQDVDPPPFRVLVLEPDLDAGRTVVDALGGPGRQVQALGSVAELLPALDRFRPELVLLASSGLGGDVDVADLAALIHGHDLHGGVPLLVMAQEEDLDRIAMVASADDVVRKPVSPGALRVRVMARLRRHRDAEAGRVVDRLTGILSRRALLRAADREIGLVRRTGQLLSAVLVDVDSMGDVNKRGGLGVGDEVLAGLARLMSRTFRETDLVGRVGGDSFCVLMPACGTANAVKRIDSVREPFHALGRDLGLSDIDFSVGVADTTEGISDVLARADRALLQARNDGGGRTRIDRDAI